ncbi:hypothetical protein BC827DRAFT_649692 [Russula dissimulans]|nr:hypothetical protein BC827DRAFT_649692 [Russula dissimulans]
MIPGSSLGYSYLATQLRDHKCDLQDARMRKEKQEQEERAKKLQLEKCRLLVQRMYAKFVHVRNTLRQQLQVSRAREQELHANLVATEQERDKLKALVSTLEVSDKKRRGITAAAEARCLEARMTALKLRAGLTVAMARTRAVQEGLDNQTRLASGRDLFSQSIAEESHVLRANLKGAEQEIACLNVELEQEHERFKVLVSILEASDKERREWEEKTASADARCSEAETAAFNLRADLSTAMARARIVEEQLDHQTEIASGKDLIIQSIAEESQVLHTKLKDEIARLDAELRHEHDRRLHETKELLDEQVRIRGRHEAAVHSVGLQARDAQERLVALRDFLSQPRRGAQPDRVHLHPPAYRPSTTGLVDTGQPPLLPERILGLGAPGLPVLSVFDPNSPLTSTASSLPYPLPRDTDDPSIRQAGYLYRISESFDQASDVAKSQQAALQELLQRMLQLESESTQVVNPNEHDDKCLQVRLAGEEFLHVRRNLKQSRETLREVETHARDVMHELDMCRVKLREGQDARRSLRFELDESAELLRLRSAELESSKVEAEMSQFKCSQIMFLSVALQERVTELEAELKTLKSTPKYSALSSAHDDSSPVADADTGMCASQFTLTRPLIPPVLEAITNNADFPVSDSIYMTVPPSLSCLLDSSLPSLSSQRSHSSLSFSHQKFSAMSPACVNSHLVFSRNMGLCTLWLLKFAC